MGILPFMSPIALFKRFAPLRDYLSAHIGRTVIIETARDYPQFVRRSQARRYDILYTAPHFALLASDSGRYRLRATYVRPLSALILVRRNGPIHKLADLAGKIVATPPPEAIVTMFGRRMLGREGLTGARSPVYRNYLSHTAAYQAVVGGEAQAAIVAVNVVHDPHDEATPLRILAHSRNFPAVGFLTASDLPERLQQRIAQVLVTLTKTRAGRRILKQIRDPASGYRPARLRNFEPLRPFLQPFGYSADPAPGSP
ncbi:MAG: phosphate/phosphite/phosphonate ABC transporter substrate-binding protein [Gammaproteobacteria bacterium]